jgi:NAD+ kinase
MRIRIVANQRNKIAVAAAEKARAFLRSKAALASSDSDLVLSFGGDGTLLRAVRTNRSVPVLGVNCGEVGFLTDIDSDNFLRHMPAILGGKFRVEKRAMLECAGATALNDIVMAPAKPAVAVRYSLWLNGQEAWKDCGDGLIVATPTGSTAYAFSAGGPVVAADAQVLVIMPLNSAGRKPALIVPDTCSVELRSISSPVGCEVVADGQERRKCPGHITINKSRHPALLARLAGGYAGLCAKVGKKARFDYGL